jgi:iron-sulfur cluster insertion protein
VATELQAQTNQMVTMTPAAAERVWELLSKEGNYNLKLRVYIHGGGCSGFQYGFAFDENLQADDCVIPSQLAEDKTVELVIDPMSMMYLSGAVIDYAESLQGAHFTVKNPHAQSTCSCGSSFSIE